MLALNKQILLKRLRRCVLLMLLLICDVGTTYFVDQTEQMERIQQRAGYDVSLTCDLKGLMDERKLADTRIHWYFKQCYGKDCYTTDKDDWTALPCEKIFCKSELLLRNVTVKYSGLYKCTVYPYRLDDVHSIDIQLVRTYQLDVKNTSLAAPEFLDFIPENKTARVDTQVVFQCRVRSEPHPTIKWFRRLAPHTNSYMDYVPHAPGNNFSTHIVRYNGRVYELLQTDPEKLIAENIYLSKLKLNGVRLHDEGFYACVAISYRGHKIREAYLHVLPGEDLEYWSDYDDEKIQTDPKEFWLLFLMPLGLAMLPLSVWLCCVVYRRCSDRNECQRMTHQYSDEEGDIERCVLGK